MGNQLDQLREAMATKVLIMEFEKDLRNIVDNSILPEIDIREIISRFEIDSDPESTEDVLGSLYIGQAIDILNIYKRFLSFETLKDLESVMNSDLFQNTIYAARNNNAHSRDHIAFEENDFARTLKLLESLNSQEWIYTSEACARIQNGKLNTDISEVLGPELGCLNNLPSREYSDTSLVGRVEEIKEIRNLLARYKIVSIIAPGGIGKSALALEVARQLTNSRDYDLVLWHSAKLNLWSIEGSIEIDNVETDLERSVSSLGQVLDSDFAGNFSDFLQVIEGERALIVLDNYETFTGADFLSLVEKLPLDANVKFLITSRHGIGSIERRFDLQPLSENAALQLLKKLAAINSVKEITNLTYELKLKLINSYSRSPLGIRWLVQCLASGKSIRDVHASSLDLLEYCVTSVLDNLSIEARSVLVMLHVYRRSIPLAELNLLLNYDYVGDLRPILQELSQRSILHSINDDQSWNEERVGLSEVVSDYFQKSFGFFTQDEIQEAKRRKAELEERLKNEESSAAPLNPWYIFIRSEADKPASANLRNALSISRRRFDDSIKITSELRAANSNYFEIDRIAAFIYSARDPERAEHHYQASYAIANSGLEKGKVAYHYADFLGKQENSLAEATKFSRIAHEIYNSAATMAQLGYFLVRGKEMEDGVDLILSAIENSNPSSKTHLISLTQLAKSYERWAEQTFSDSNEFNLFWNLCEKGFESAKIAFTSNRGDAKAAETLVQIVLLTLRKFKRISQGDSSTEVLIYRFANEARLLSKAMSILGSDYKANSRLRLLVQEMADERPEYAELHKILSETVIDLTGSKLPDGSLVGKVTTLFPEKGYGFIEYLDGQDYYFHVSHLVPERDWALLETGALVSFQSTPESQESIKKKSPTATSVRILLN